MPTGGANRRIQRACAQLEPWNYHVHPANLGLLVLGMVSALPTLVHRIVRRGNNVNTLCDLVQGRDMVLRRMGGDSSSNG
jgi:hypothetical protein